MHACSAVSNPSDLMNCSLQAPLFMRLSWQEYYSWMPFPLPGNLSDPGIECTSPVSLALAYT